MNLKDYKIKFRSWVIKIRVYIILGVILLILPVLFNEIIIWNPPFIDVATDNNWIGFYGSYFGSIVGGALTLLGVRHTITFQKNQDFINDAPVKIRKMDRIIEEIVSLIKEVKANKSGDRLYFHFTNGEILRKIDKMLDESSLIDGYCYYSIYGVHIALLTFFELNESSIELDDFGGRVIKRSKEKEVLENLLKVLNSLEFEKNRINKHKKNIRKKYSSLINY